MNEVTPMMQHYLQTKEAYKDCILFYRLGDFYEMFFDDAITVSKELELTLTGKSCGLEERAPMCGVPFHAVEHYLSKLVQKGYKVAICEQVEDPKLATGIVKREVVRVVTPGTNIDSFAMDETKNNYIMSVVYLDSSFGISIADVSTGDYYVTEVDSARKLYDEINRFSPTEMICNDAFFISGIEIEDLKNRLGITLSAIDAHFFNEDDCVRLLLSHFKVSSLEGLGLLDLPIGVIAAGSLLGYLREMQKTELSQLITIHPYSIGKYMIIDSSSRRNLELVETLREKQKRGSLLGVLDKTKTAMGARTLRAYIEQPLIEKEEIIARQDAIASLNGGVEGREEIRKKLNNIYDLERLSTRVTYQTANARDLIAFKNSIGELPGISNILKNYEAPLLQQLYEEMDTLTDLYERIDEAIVEEPPLSLREGGLLKEGYHEEVDRLRRARSDGKSWLADLEAKEREKTGIKNLKIKYNKVFGYYLEVTNSFLSMVPDYFTRKQTLTNAERFITPELKEMEDTILGAEDRLVSLEYDLFCELRNAVAAQVVRIQQTAKAVAKLDVFASLAVVAEKNRYCRPKITEDGTLQITEGRHPVVEKMIQGGLFVPNDTKLDTKKERIAIITGPNMAGKSTYMRQTALIVLMAQIGSFVPAESATIGIVDRIFTRVGASDDLASGQSTFMVEMTEVANILRNATPNSLLILDEIGRGTSTFDGLSIAWAVVEYISNPKLIGAKTLFATHYHELTELEGKLSSVHNYCIAVKEKGDDIVFLRKIVPGGADKSYGIQVAKLAGLPEPVIERAKEIVTMLGENDIAQIAKNIDAEDGLKKETKKTKQPSQMEMAQISLFDTISDADIIEELRNTDVLNMTPVEAMNKLYELQSKVKNRW